MNQVPPAPGNSMSPVYIHGKVWRRRPYAVKGLPTLFSSFWLTSSWKFWGFRVYQWPACGWWRPRVQTHLVWRHCPPSPNGLYVRRAAAFYWSWIIACILFQQNLNVMSALSYNANGRSMIKKWKNRICLEEQRNEIGQLLLLLSLQNALNTVITASPFFTHDSGFERYLWYKIVSFQVDQIFTTRGWKTLKAGLYLRLFRFLCASICFDYLLGCSYAITTLQGGQRRNEKTLFEYLFPEVLLVTSWGFISLHYSIPWP